MNEVVRGLHHAAITAPPDLEDEVVQWYGTVFGLEPLEKPEGTRDGGAWFSLGRGELHVTIDDHNPPPVAHLAIEVGDLDEVIERLRAAACHIEQAAAIPGRRRLYTRDPAGNRLEILALDGTA